ncbi:MAG: hypothetical protein AAFX39_14920, partial [Pseudomonadota bacterium]
DRLPGRPGDAEDARHGRLIVLGEDRAGHQGVLRARQTLFGIARTTGQTVEDVLAWPDRIDDVEVADIEDVFDRFVTIERSVTAFLRAPEPPEAAQVEDTEGDRS